VNEDRGSAWANWPLPDPTTTGLPGSQRYDTTVGGVAIDQVTGLMWQRVVPADAASWSGAKAYCGCLSLADHDDWRLPSRIELVSILDYTRQEPPLDPQVFPDTPVDWFWTSTPVADSDPPMSAWYISHFDGNTHHAALDTPYRVRCVRGPKAAGPRFIAGGDGTVRDAATGLTWQQVVDGTQRTWPDARTYCSALAVAGGGWRLPNMKELQTLVDERRIDPSIDGALFPSTPSSGFWASTPLAGMPPFAWFVDFYSGVAYNSMPEHPYSVRCVRP
jgi:hypothetical protein